MPNLYVALEQDLGLDSPDFCELLEPWFEERSKQAGADLMQFFGQDPAGFLDENELDGVPTGNQWFAASAGLEAIKSLMSALETDNSKAAERARDELSDLKSVLEAAEAKKIGFHLALDI